MTASNDAKKTKLRTIWVVMFDTLVLPEPDAAFADESADEHITKSFNSFDDLEVRSTYFEQYVVQNVKLAASDSERLGGDHCMASLIQNLQQAGHAVMLLDLHPPADAISQSDVSSASFAANSVTGLAQGLGVEASSIAIDPCRELPDQLSMDIAANAARASLVWFRVRNQQASQSAIFRERMLSQILRWHASLSAQRPVLLVTALCGEAGELKAPLESAVYEGRIRVPLWIDTGRQHARRVQTLAGSFDILPTIADLLNCPVQDASLHDAGDVSRPCSLLPLCCLPEATASHALTAGNIESPQSVGSLRAQMERRILRLSGDRWTGLRAQQYQLIRGDVVNTDLQDCQPEETRQLFLKPDDLWNVNDAIVTYEIIADEMESQTS